MIRDMRLRALLELIEGCPQACRWREAQLNDDDFVNAVLDAEDASQDAQDAEYAPRLSEYTVTNSQLGQLIALVTLALRFLGLEDTDAEELLFPSPRNPIAEAREMRENEMDEQLVQDAILNLLGIK